MNQNCTCKMSVWTSIKMIPSTLRYLQYKSAAVARTNGQVHIKCYASSKTLFCGFCGL